MVMVEGAELTEGDRISCTDYFVRSRTGFTAVLARLADEAEAIGERLKSEPPPSRTFDEEEPIALLPEHV